MPSYLALDAVDGAICCSLVCLPVQCHFDREPAPGVVSNDLDAANGLAPGPLSDSLQALFSESPVAHSNCIRRLGHEPALYDLRWPPQGSFSEAAHHTTRPNPGLTSGLPRVVARPRIAKIASSVLGLRDRELCPAILIGSRPALLQVLRCSPGTISPRGKQPVYSLTDVQA
jgi:hypothetical protein